MDNVIYANFGAKKRITTPEQRRGATHPYGRSPFSPAGQRVMDLTRKKAEGMRLGRGEDYYTNGHVTGTQVLDGRVRCLVAGSQNEPFEVTLTFPYRSSEKLSAAYAAIAATTNGMKLVREGHLSAQMLDHLVGSLDEDIYFDCNCPDKSMVCKHAVAAAYTVAEKMTASPGMVLDIRGQGMAGLEALIAGYQKETGAESEDNESFWNGMGLPDLPDPRPAPAINDSDLNMLHKAMRLVSYTSLEQLRAVSDIEDMYDRLVNGDPPESFDD